MPSVFYAIPKGELTVIRAFYERELDERNEMLRQAEGKASLVIPVDVS